MLALKNATCQNCSVKVGVVVVMTEVMKMHAPKYLASC